MNYKKGDKIQIRSDLIDGKQYGKHWVYIHQMNQYLGKTVTIKSINYPNNDNSYYEIEEDNDKYRWTDEMFQELMEEKNNSLTKKDLIKGEIYFYSDPRWDNDYIELYDGDKYSCIRISKKNSSDWVFYYSYSHYFYYYGKIAFIRKSTSEEKQWLLACIKAGKGVSKEEISKKEYKSIPGEPNKEELLEEAKRRYPIGCRVISVFDNEVYDLKEDSLVYEENTNSVRRNIYLFYKGKWAKIISKPEIKEPLINKISNYNSKVDKLSYDVFIKSFSLKEKKSQLEFQEPVIFSSKKNKKGKLIVI